MLAKRSGWAIGIYSSAALKPGAVGTVSLVEACAARDRARLMLAVGTDPSEAKCDAKRAAMIDSETSFEAVARRWWAHWRGDKTARYAGYVLARLEADAFPEIGHKPVRDLTAALIQHQLAWEDPEDNRRQFGDLIDNSEYGV